MTFKCSSCGKDAFAYLIEADGARIYLCLDHFPDADDFQANEGQKTGEPSKAPKPDHLSLGSLLRHLLDRVPQFLRHNVGKRELRHRAGTGTV